MAIDPRINAGAPYSPTGTILINGPNFNLVRGGTVTLSVGTTVTAPPVKLPAMTASMVLVQGVTVPAPIAWALDASTAPSASVPVAYSTAGVGGSPGDALCSTTVPEAVALTTTQQALLAAGNLYLSAVSSQAGTLALTFAAQA